jgi:hypothetical protein
MVRGFACRVKPGAQDSAPEGTKKVRYRAVTFSRNSDSDANPWSLKSNVGYENELSFSAAVAERRESKVLRLLFVIDRWTLQVAEKLIARQFSKAL